MAGGFKEFLEELFEPLGGTTIRRTLVSAETGRAFEIAGYPDEAGTALFVREKD